MAFVKIDITAQDIAESTKHTLNLEDRWCQSCPIALASRRVVPNFLHISQKHIVIRTDDGDGVYRIELPKEARDFVRMADTHLSVRAGLTKADEYDVDQESLNPIRFSVYIPDKYVTKTER